MQVADFLCHFRMEWRGAKEEFTPWKAAGVGVASGVSHFIVTSSLRINQREEGTMTVKRIFLALTLAVVSATTLRAQAQAQPETEGRRPRVNRPTIKSVMCSASFRNGCRSSW